MSTRRNLLIVLGAAAFRPQALFAQSKQPRLIGWLALTSRKSGKRFLARLNEGLAAQGWKDGRQIVIEERWADGQRHRLAPLAQELAAKKPALIVASAMRTAVAAAKAAPKIPIVMVSNNDPIVAGLVSNLARPGGMITGLGGFSAEIAGKYLELLLAVSPQVKRVGFLAYTANPTNTKIVEAVRRSAEHYSVEALFAEVGRAGEIEPALSGLAKEGAEGLVVLTGALFGVERLRIVKFALAQHWPTVAAQRASVNDGTLLTYGADFAALHRRAAYYVDRILKGARPGDLPIEQPMTFELVVNLKTAKALGLTIPPEIMVQATRVIE